MYSFIPGVRDFFYNFITSHFPISMTANFQVTFIEVVKVHLHDAFMLAQPPLTRAAKFIFVKHVTVSGEGDWLYKYKTYLDMSMWQDAVDDGRAFDMCGGLHPHLTTFAY
jgi:hypothetical protein